MCTYTWERRSGAKLKIAAFANWIAQIDILGKLLKKLLLKYIRSAKVIISKIHARVSIP